MAVGFTSRERENITKALLEAAGRHAAMEGMKKTSVDELCAEAGISKGAFYSFFPSKEHLFLTVMERWQEEISRHAEAALRQAGELDGPGRAALMMKTACRAMRQKSMERFLQEDMPLILRKLPQEDLRNHTLTEEAFVHNILQKTGVRLSIAENVAYAMICLLFHTLLCEEHIGPDFEEALERLIDCACQQIVQP